MVVIVIGLAGSAFNRNVESEMALHDKLVDRALYAGAASALTQDSNLNYDSEYALLDVYKGGKKQFQMAPEKRVYLASGQPQTMVAIHSVPALGSVRGLRGHKSRYRPADHQGVSESAGGLDLGRAC